MDQTTCLRSADDHDAEFLYQVFSQSHGAELDLSVLADAQREAMLRMQFQAQQDQYRRQYPTADCDVVLSHGQAVGYMIAVRGPETFVLVDIALLPAFRGQGIGSRLVAELIELAESANQSLYAHVRKGSSAWALWQRLGFRQVADDGVFLNIERPPG